MFGFIRFQYWKLFYRPQDEEIVESTEHKYFYEDVFPFLAICINN